MIKRGLTYLLAIASIMLCISHSAISSAAPRTSQSCADVETLFARGTGEPDGIGDTGQLFVDALQSHLNGKTMNVYAVNYPASRDWPTGIEGIRDASNHIQTIARQCPHTKMILSGFSQGAAVMGFVTADSAPDGFDASALPAPMPAEIANHVAAVVLFGTPNERAMSFLGQPPVTIGPLYVDKTLQLCTVDDPVCSDGFNIASHHAEAYSAIVDDGAVFAMNRIDPSSSAGAASS